MEYPPSAAAGLPSSDNGRMRAQGAKNFQWKIDLIPAFKAEGLSLVTVSQPNSSGRPLHQRRNHTGNARREDLSFSVTASETFVNQILSNNCLAATGR